MNLRPWQLDCVQSAKKSFLSGQKNFLSLATPGAGKTVMAAALAKSLLDDDLIDYVICFAPSKSVTVSIVQTFTNVLKRGMDGVMSDVGAVYTYQFLAMNSTKNWKILRNHRVLLVFDEIHHAGGAVEALANSWGREILTKLKDNATFILSMTGTPWRSDNTPVTLARYIEPDSRIACDYTYGLTQAVRDGVCRVPEICLFDNNSLLVGDEHYSSITEALENSDVRYADLLENTVAMHYMLKQAVEKLRAVRLTHSDAAGVVVAKSIEHAHQILKILRQKYRQTAVLVTYQEQNPEKIIERFRHDKTQWIVSISMVSEGTDIPRLRLCVHLSTVRTELFFRQVLGRVLRTIPDLSNKKGWLYTFAEPRLLEFAERIQLDLPEHKCKQVTMMETEEAVDNNLPTGLSSINEGQPKSAGVDLELLDENHSESDVAFDVTPLFFKLDGQFRHEVFSIF